MDNFFLRLWRVVSLAVVCGLMLFATQDCRAGPAPVPDATEVSDWSSLWVGSCNSSSTYNHDCQAVLVGSPVYGESVLCGATNQPGPGSCYKVQGTRASDGQIGTYQIGYFLGMCPAGWTLTAGACVCASGNCAAPPDSSCPGQEARNAERQWLVVTGLSQSAAMAMTRNAARGTAASCVNGCVVTSGTSVCGGIGNVWSCELTGNQAQAKGCGGSGVGSFDGESFAPTPNQTPGTVTQEIEAEKPPAGKCPGMVNGIKVWVTCDSTIGAGTSTSTTTSTNSNGAGTVTVSRDGETVCNGSGCTTTYKTTSTVSGPDGAGGMTTTQANGTSQVAESKEEYCRRVPDAPSCAGNNRFSGSCAGAFSCSGDAIQCAVAKGVNDAACLLTKESTESALYATEKGKSGSQVPGTGSIALSGASFDQTDLLPGGHCVADFAVDVAGHSVSIPLSNVCPWLLQLGNLLIAISFLIAIKIVGRE